MPQVVSGVVKGARVRLAEPRKLNGLPPEQAGRRLPPVTARIVEQTSDRAVVEVVCACGTVIHLCCDHEGPPAADTEQQ